MTTPSELPSTEQMLDDLSKVPGLDFFWQTLAMASGVPGLFTAEEQSIIDRARGDAQPSPNSESQ